MPVPDLNSGRAFVVSILPWASVRHHRFLAHLDTDPESHRLVTIARLVTVAIGGATAACVIVPRKPFSPRTILQNVLDILAESGQERRESA